MTERPPPTRRRWRPDPPGRRVGRTPSARTASSVIVVVALVAGLAVHPRPAAGQAAPAEPEVQEPEVQEPGEPDLVEPATPGPDAGSAGGPALTFEQLGLGPSVGIGGRTGSRRLVIPVPEGMVVTQLAVTARMSSATTGGRLEVRADGVPLTAVDLDATAPAGVAFTVGLAEVAVEDGAVELEVLARLQGIDDERCAALLSSPEVFLVDGSVTFGGDPVAPDTVNRFLPPVLTHVDLVVPDPYSAQQAEAVLRLAANVALQYGAQEPRVALHVGQAPEREPSPFRRTIEVVQGPPGVTASSSAAGPVLTVSGDGVGLAQQVDLLTTELDRLAVAGSVVVGRSQPIGQELVRGRRTLAALGFGNLQGTGVGRIELGVPFSQSALGGPTTAIVAHLVGTTTPVPDGASASLSVVLNDVVLSSQALHGDGSFDVRTELPDGLLRRDNDVLVRVDYAPPGGVCQDGAQPMTVQLDPASMLAGAPGTSLPDGFERFPQALLPTFTVAFGALDGPSLAVGTDLVVALQRASRRLLRPEVHPWAAAVSSDAATLFVGQENVDFDAALQPPLQLLEGRDVQVTTDPLQAQLGGQVAALEAFSVGPRDVLLATWQGEGSLLADLTGRVVAEPGGWGALAGDVVVLGSVGAPEQLSLRTPAPGSALPGVGEGPTIRWGVVLVGLLAAAAVALAAVAWRRRARTPRADR